MRLELKIFNIKDVQFGERTFISDGVLFIDRSELKNLILQDRVFENVEIELAHPGERCRIVKVLDVIEPRAKISPGDEDFPGAVGRQMHVGRGQTGVLRGTAIVLSDYREIHEQSISGDPNGEIIDMYGPGAEIGIYGKTHNIVILATSSHKINTHKYMTALKIAGLKTASYLGKVTRDLLPDEIEVYELPPLTEIPLGKEKLPRVVYIFQILTLQFDPILGEPVLYGKNISDIVPTIIHPNEILDGAITSPFPTLNLQTYHIQNHPIIKELYKRHGNELLFIGVIIMTAPNNVSDIERVAHMASGIAKYILGADGAILTKAGGGAPELTMARTAQLCEQLGIKTTLAMVHMGADISDAKYGATTIFSMPEVDAIVSMGIPFMELKLPSVDRVIGRPSLEKEGPKISEEIIRSIRWIKGSQCQIGTTRLKAVRY